MTSYMLAAILATKASTFMDRDVYSRARKYTLNPCSLKPSRPETLRAY